MRKVLKGIHLLLVASTMNLVYAEESVNGTWLCTYQTIPDFTKVEISTNTITKLEPDGRAKTLSIINRTEGVTSAKIGHAVGKAINIDYFHFDPGAKKFYQISGVIYANQREESSLPGLVELVANCQRDY